MKDEIQEDRLNARTSKRNKRALAVKKSKKILLQALSVNKFGKITAVNKYFRFFTYFEEIITFYIGLDINVNDRRQIIK